MTLQKKLLSLITLAFLLAANCTYAQVRPAPRPGEPGRGPGHGGPRPEDPDRGRGGVRPEPRPGDGRRPGHGPGHGHRNPRPIPRPPIAPLPPPPRPIQPPPPAYNPGEEVFNNYVGRWVANETLNLGRIFYLDRRFYGYEVVAVSLSIQGGAYLGDVELMINNQSVDRDYVDQGYITLYPYDNTYGREIENMNLRVNGQAYIEYVSIILRRSYDSRPEEVRLPINILRRVSAYDDIQLSDYFDLRSYFGYKVRSVEVVAEAIHNQAYITLMINGLRQGSSVFVDRFSRSYFLYPNFAGDEIGYEVRSISLGAQGDLLIRGVVLNLSRW